MGGHHPIRQGHEWNKKVKEGQIHSLFEVGCPPFALILELLVLGPLTLGWELHHQFPLILRPLDFDRILPLGFLVLQLADSRLWDLLASIMA